MVLGNIVVVECLLFWGSNGFEHIYNTIHVTVYTLDTLQRCQLNFDKGVSTEADNKKLHLMNYPYL